MIVRFAGTAKADLQEIGAYNARDNAARAVLVVSGLRAACLELSSSPQRYAVVPRYADRGIRKRPHRGYLIFYRVTDVDVQILRVLHGARDYDALLTSA